MKRNILTTIFIAVCISGFTQVFLGSDAQVGVDEQLDKTLPLDLKFCTEHKDSVSLGELIDKPTVLSFVYFDCPGLCNPLQQGISELIDQSDLILGEEYKVITISFNYKDDPDKAEKKKKNFAECISKDKCTYWYYLTADSAAINDILKAVGYKVKITGMDFAHPSGIVIVSPQGKITRYLYGLKFLPFDFKMAIIEAQKGIARPSINKVLDFCFAYDPEGKKYTLQITKLAATMIIFFAVVLLTYLIIKSRRERAKK